MDNDFNRARQRTGQHNIGSRPLLRPIQPQQRPTAPPLRPIDSLKPTSPTPSYTPLQQNAAIKPSLPPTTPQHNQNAMSNGTSHIDSSNNPTSNIKSNSTTVNAQNSKPQSANSLNFAPPSKKKSKKKKTLLVGGIILLALITISIVAYLLYGRLLDQLDKKQEELTYISTQYYQLKKDNEELNKKLLAATEGTAGMSQSTRTAITTAISNKNYRAIEQYIQDNVLVVIAASDGVGRRSPEQAVSDLKFIDDASQPWNFNLPAETLANYKDGDYKQYFPNSAIVGKSADGKIISFSTTPGGKISVIFMCEDESLL